MRIIKVLSILLFSFVNIKGIISYDIDMDLINNGDNTCFISSSIMYNEHYGYASIDTKGIDRFYFSFLNENGKIDKAFQLDLDVTDISAYSNFLCLDNNHNYILIKDTSSNAYLYNIKYDETYELIDNSIALETSLALSFNKDNNHLISNTGIDKLIDVTSVSEKSINVVNKDIETLYAYSSKGELYKVDSNNKVYLSNSIIPIDLIIDGIGTISYSNILGIDVYNDKLYLAYKDSSKYYLYSFNVDRFRSEGYYEYDNSKDYNYVLNNGHLYLSEVESNNLDIIDIFNATSNRYNDIRSDIAYVYSLSINNECIDIYALDTSSDLYYYSYDFDVSSVSNKNLYPSFYALGCALDQYYFYDLNKDELVVSSSFDGTVKHRYKIPNEIKINILSVKDPLIYDYSSELDGLDYHLDSYGNLYLIGKSNHAISILYNDNLSSSTEIKSIEGFNKIDDTHYEISISSGVTSLDIKPISYFNKVSFENTVINDLSNNIHKLKVKAYNGVSKDITLTINKVSSSTPSEKKETSSSSSVFSVSSSSSISSIESSSVSSSTTSSIEEIPITEIDQSSTKDALIFYGFCAFLALLILVMSIVKKNDKKAENEPKNDTKEKIKKEVKKVVNRAINKTKTKKKSKSKKKK